MSALSIRTNMTARSSAVSARATRVAAVATVLLATVLAIVLGRSSEPAPTNGQTLACTVDSINLVSTTADARPDCPDLKGSVPADRAEGAQSGR